MTNDQTSKLLRVDIPIEDEVTNFAYDAHSYCAYTGRGLRLNIARAVTVQPEIVDEEDFSTYLWVEAKEGFFLLSQRFVKHVPQRWLVQREMIPLNATGFFHDFQAELPGYIEGLTPA